MIPVVLSGEQVCEANYVRAEECPEYSLVSDCVGFVIMGRSSNQPVPLTGAVDFRFNKNALAMRIDEARHESKFSIKEMILRSEWDLMEKHMMEQWAIRHTRQIRI